MYWPHQKAMIVYYYYLILFKHSYWPRNSHMVFLKNTYWLEKFQDKLKKIHKISKYFKIYHKIKKFQNFKKLHKISKFQNFQLFSSVTKNNKAIVAFWYRSIHGFIDPLKVYWPLTSSSVNIHVLLTGP